MTECKFCYSDYVVKNGHVKGKQVYLCRECNGQFTNLNSLPNYRCSLTVLHYIFLYASLGYSLRAIERGIRVFHNEKLSHVAISNIIKKHKHRMEQVRDNRYLLEYLLDECTSQLAFVDRFGESVDEDVPINFKLLKEE